jgi:hypothetical protein
MDRTRISFAEAEGKAKFPAILSWGQIDQRLRSALWTPFYLFLDEHMEYNPYDDGPAYSLREPASSMMRREFVLHRHRFISDYEESFSRTAYIDNWSDFFKKSDYIAIFDFVTFTVRDHDCPATLVDRIADALDEPFSPYRLSVEAKTIFPAIGESETKALERDIKLAFSSPFSGSKAHIQSALNALGEGDYRSTVRESIHAVESAVKDFTGDTGATLSKAVKSLVGEEGVHKALADAFDKLYAYTSDEKGIRHALVFGNNEKVGLDEAAFFLSACTAFVGFLSRKKAAK